MKLTELAHKIPFIIATSLALATSGCGGGGSGSTPTPPSPTQTAITASANPMTVKPGGNTTITYTANNLDASETVKVTTTISGDPSVTTNTSTCTVSNANKSCTIIASVPATDTNTKFTVSSQATGGNKAYTVNNLTINVSSTPGPGPSSCPASKWPGKPAVGYIMGPIGNDITNTLTNGYDIIVYAFGTQSSANANLSKPGFNLATIPLLPSQITAIHAAKKLALLSVGGQNNTFVPDPQNPTSSAQNMAELLHTNGFDGLDLDLETIPVGADYLITYINELRTSYKSKSNKEIMLTAAPQINSTSPTYLAPTAIFTADLLNKACFDAVLVQTYNQYGGAIFNGLQGSYLSLHNNLMADIGFLSAAFTKLTTTVPSTTKIVLGVPSYMNMDYLRATKDQVTATNSPASYCMSGKEQNGTTAISPACTGIGLSLPTNICKDIEAGRISGNAQYGGLMTWDINAEYDQKNTSPWAWITGVRNCQTKIVN